MLLNRESYSLESQRSPLQVVELQDAVASAKQHMEGASLTFCGFGETINQHRDQIERVTETVTGHTDHIASHSQWVTELQVNFAVVSEKLTKHNDEIAQGDSVVKHLVEQQECIGQLQIQVSTTDTTVAELNKKVAELDKTVTELHNGQCRQAKRNKCLINNNIN